MTKKKSIKKEALPKEVKTEAVAESNEFNKQQSYSLDNAISWVKKLAKEKFDASVEVHVKLGIDPKKGDQQVRSAVSLPHGTGKTVKVAAFVQPENEKAAKEAGADYAGGDELIAEIKKTEKTDFQVAVAEPAMMKNLAQIAKILGTRGLMPSPKNETVTPKVVEAIGELKKGKISFKNDDTANLHAVIGKISFADNLIKDNFETLVEAVKKAKPTGAKGIYIRNVSISSSMGTGVKVDI